MAVLIAIWFLVASLLNSGVQSVDWSATSFPDGQHMYACAGDTVTLVWQYALNTGDVLSDVQWVYDGRSQELVAMSSRGTFLATPTFSQRVARVDNAGLSLSRVLVPDSGNYSVEVNVYTQAGSVHTVLRRTVVLHVSDGLMTTDGSLHVTQLPDAVFDNVTAQWVIQLRCGTFLFGDNPSFYMQWTTPSGLVFNSTGYNNGRFYLNLPMPIESGTYACAIPAHLAASVCLHGNGGHAAVTVESVEARLLLLEKENWDLKHQLAASQTSEEQQRATLGQLSAQMSDLAQRLTASQTSQNQEIQRLSSELQQAQNQLATTAANLTSRLAKIEDVEHTHVAFHASGLLARTPPNNSPLIYSNVVLNQGNAYSPSTGYFTAPHSGLYFFLVRTAIASDSGEVSHDLLVNGSIVDNVYTNINVGSHVTDQCVLQATQHLLSGQRVNVRATPNRPYYPVLSVFTGFLLSRDP